MQEDNASTGIRAWIRALPGWMVVASAAVLISASPAGAAAAKVGNPVGGTPLRRVISLDDVSSLRRMADIYPCATFALLHILRTQAESHGGTLYLERIPSSLSLGLMLDHAAEESAQILGADPQRNPYSDATSFVEVRWSTQRLDDRSSVLTFRAELVDRIGRSLNPPHVIEPAAAAILSRAGIRFLGLPLAQ